MHLERSCLLDFDDCINKIQSASLRPYKAIRVNFEMSFRTRQSFKPPLEVLVGFCILLVETIGDTVRQ
ncbi:hypothetical protein K1719_007023 [Acacia pycnantha]|nr:hypothetical protein K1719_007023 [Acacia pycnantha]